MFPDPMAGLARLDAAGTCHLQRVVTGEYERFGRRMGWRSCHQPPLARPNKHRDSVAATFTA